MGNERVCEQIYQNPRTEAINQDCPISPYLFPNLISLCSLHTLVFHLKCLHSYHTISHFCVRTVTFLQNVYSPTSPHFWSISKLLHPSKPHLSDTSSRKLSFIIHGTYELFKILNLHFIFMF